MKSIKKSTSSLLIRKFKLDDYKTVLALWNEAHLPYKPHGRDSKTSIKWQITQSNTIYLVAEINGTLVGTLFGSHDSRKGWVNRLAVSPSYQHKGIASQLVANFEQRLSTLGITIVAALIEDWNTASMTVFQRWGYKKSSDVFYFTKRKNNEI